ncbi:hypothetical protein SADUNF_Sadunf14G0039000 [Salix dunnii]|uniref:Uncharacterized protein n=1 Tax=Salix dunnii TaxID=1413687 RepID=A0A835MK65_9ROSI|nr:hypothetical protein SADUNF_Sadunf14G0039000 [Salix dunnii]
MSVLSLACRLIKSHIRRSFFFTSGIHAGIYISRNYNVPDIRKLAETGLSLAKHHIETTYRKLSSQKESDDVSE